MKLKTFCHDGNYNKKSCYVHARAGAFHKEHLLLTLQRLDVTGCDAFSPIEICESFDGGATFTEPRASRAFFVERVSESIDRVACDGYPMLHKKTGKMLLMGHFAHYRKGENRPAAAETNFGYYAVYNEKTGDFDARKEFSFPPYEGYQKASPGSAQFFELPCGDLLIPIYKKKEGAPYEVSVIRCAFDGETITPLAYGNTLVYPYSRGACEPSVIGFGGKFYLTIRNDEIGLHAQSEDGIHFSEPLPWRWDNGDVLENYNTQQHFLLFGGKLFLVYTRRGMNNDHVFRHRAPLLIAEVDTDRMCLLRETERIAVPERGARLGNFGVTNVDDSLAYITVTEWMQPRGCEAYGSDNALFVTKITK